MAEANFIETIRDYAELGNLADQFQTHLKNREDLPLDDIKCMAVVRQAMDAYFEAIGQTPDLTPATSLEELNHIFVKSCYDHAEGASLRECIVNFHVFDHSRLPEDDESCRRVVERGMEVYWEMQE